MIRRVNDMKLEEFLTEFDGWIICAWMSYGSIPCEHFRPEFEGVHKGACDRILFVDIDVDEHPEYTEHMGIHAVPTTTVYYKAKEVDRFEGPYSRERLAQDLNALFQGKRRRKQ